MATAVSIVLFNLIRIIIIYYKMKIQPFSKKTLITVLILFLIYLLCYQINLENIFLSIAIKTLVSSSIFILFCLKINLSDDINKLINDIYLRFLKKRFFNSKNNPIIF